MGRVLDGSSQQPVAGAIVTLGGCRRARLIAQGRQTIDVRVGLTPMSRITGIVTDGTGAPAAGILVEFEPQGIAPPDRSYAIGAARLAPRRTAGDGRFAFPGVAPGEYRVLAVDTSSVREDDAKTPVRFGASIVSLSGDDVAVDLALQAPLAFEGSLAFQGPSPAAAPTSVRLSLQQTRVTPGGELKTFTATTAASGRFVIVGLTPERYTSRATAPGGWSVRSMTAGGRELLDAPLVLGGIDARSDVVVTFTDRPASLDMRIK